MTIPKQAIDAAAKAIADSIGHGMSEKCFDHARAALTAAAPYMRYKREFNISSCTVDLSGADYKRFLDGVTGFDVSLDGEMRSFAEYNEGDRVFLDVKTGNLDAHNLFILSRPAFEKKVQERISSLPHMSGSAREQALEDAAQNIIENRSSTFKARNGRMRSIEDENGEQCWIVSFDDMGDLEAALKSQPSPQHPDDIAVDSFATQMKAKLAQKRAEGRSGWQNMSAQDLSDLVYEHVAKGDPIDVANLCMMLAMNGQHITPAPDRWQPIETAPKDGTKFDVWMMPHGYRYTDVFWSDIQETWCRDGYYPDEPDPLPEVPYPAFWRLLPPAPQTGGQHGRE